MDTEINLNSPLSYISDTSCDSSSYENEIHSENNPYKVFSGPLVSPPVPEYTLDGLVLGVLNKNMEIIRLYLTNLRCKYTTIPDIQYNSVFGSYCANGGLSPSLVEGSMDLDDLGDIVYDNETAYESILGADSLDTHPNSLRYYISSENKNDEALLPTEIGNLERFLIDEEIDTNASDNDADFFMIREELSSEVYEN